MAEGEGHEGCEEEGEEGAEWNMHGLERMGANPEKMMLVGGEEEETTLNVNSGVCTTNRWWNFLTGRTLAASRKRNCIQTRDL